MNKKKYANQPGAMKKSYTNEVDLVDNTNEQKNQEGRLANTKKNN
ncbi:hypothetical protein [Alkalihalobacillus sp. CinArs1]|nr:hypothetical protein [Alkalihalobacillus sp. CinArs1]